MNGYFVVDLFATTPVVLAREQADVKLFGVQRQRPETLVVLTIADVEQMAVQRLLQRRLDAEEEVFQVVRHEAVPFRFVVVFEELLLDVLQRCVAFHPSTSDALGGQFSMPYAVFLRRGKGPSLVCPPVRSGRSC